MGTRHFGVVLVRTKPAAEAGGEQHRLHDVDPRTTPSDRMVASACASTRSRSACDFSHSAYAATDSTGVFRARQPRPSRAPVSEKMWRVSPKRYSPVMRAGRSEP